MTYEELLSWVDAHPWIDPETEIFNWWALPGWVQRDILEVVETYKEDIEEGLEPIEEDLEDIEEAIAEAEEDIALAEEDLAEFSDLEEAEEVDEAGE